MAAIFYGRFTHCFHHSRNTADDDTNNTSHNNLQSQCLFYIFLMENKQLLGVRTPVERHGLEKSVNFM